MKRELSVSEFREELMRHLRYEPTSGKFTWLTNRHNHVRVGRVAGGLRKIGYLVINFDRRHYYAHRLAWLFCKGVWPAGSIDHIDGNKANNAIDNLRDVRHQVNMHNTHRANRNNTSGYQGVSAKRDRWRAIIGLNGKQIALGSFDTPQQAHEAYLRAKKQFHPEAKTHE